MEPVPSMIPVIVEIARSFPLRDYCLPRSAAQTEDMMLFSELMKKPWKNIAARNADEDIA